MKINKQTNKQKNTKWTEVNFLHKYWTKVYSSTFYFPKGYRWKVFLLQHVISFIISAIKAKKVKNTRSTFLAIHYKDLPHRK